METLRAPLSLPSTRLGCHILYIVLFAFVGLTFSPWELGSLSLYYKLYDTVYNSSLFVNPFSLFGLIKEEAWQLWTKLTSERDTTSSLSLTSIPPWRLDGPQLA